MRRIAWLAVLGLVGCGDDDGPSCVEGTTQVCSCSATVMGVQICDDEGRFGACECEGTDAGPGVDAFVPEDDAGTVDGGGAEDSGSCTPTSEALARVVLPVDLILVADASGSMTAELQAIEDGWAPSLVEPLAEVTDVQTIVVAPFGTGSLQLCFDDEATGGSEGCGGTPTDVEDRFHHYATRVQSFDSLCVLLRTHGGELADDFALHSEGWGPYLRDEAVKAIVVLSDDRPACTVGSTMVDDRRDDSPTGMSGARAAAETFDAALLALSEESFGTAAARKYVLHSVVGLQAPAPLAPIEASEDFVRFECSTASSVGAGYQWISKGTGGLRFPSCESGEYDLFLEAVASDTADRAQTCRFRLEEPLDGEVIQVGDAAIEEVADADACEGEGYFLEGGEVVLCPDSCETATEDEVRRARLCE